MTRTDVVKAARSYIGVRWGHQGRREDKMDCLGLVVKVAQDVGFTVDDRVNYGVQATDESMLQECARQLVNIQRADLLPGDVVVMRFGSNRHIGIAGDYLYGGLTLIHAQTMAPRKVVENQLSESWLRSVNAKIAGCFSFPGIK